MERFNTCLINLLKSSRAFPGSSLKKHLLKYMVPTSTEENSGRITIQEGSNDIGNKHAKSEKTAIDIANRENLCRSLFERCFNFLNYMLQKPEPK